MEGTAEDYGRLDYLTDAIRMVATQADCAPADAVILIILRAQDTRRTVAEIAQATLDGRIRFGGTSEPSL